MSAQPTSNDGSSTDNSNESIAVADIPLDDEHALTQFIYDLIQRVNQLEQQQDEQQEMMNALGDFLQMDNPQEELIEYIKGLEDTVEEQDETIKNQEKQLNEKDEIIEEQNEIIDEYKDYKGGVDELIDEINENQDKLVEIVREEIDENEISESNKERLEELENEFAEYRSQNEKDKAQIRSTVHEADQQSSTNVNVIDKVNQKVDTIKSKFKRVSGGRSSLEQIVRLPDKIAQEALSKNQLRARAIVRDLKSVEWDTTMQGKVVESSAIRDKLRETYSKAHHQTVARVMEFIADMGGEQVELFQSQDDGRNKLSFETDLIDQLQNTEQLDTDDIENVNTSGVMPTVTKGWEYVMRATTTV